MTDRGGDLLDGAAKRFKEAQAVETRLRDELIEHLNAEYPGEAGHEARTDTATAFRTARAVVALGELGPLKEAREDTQRLARAYLDAVGNRQDAQAALSEHL